MQCCHTLSRYILDRTTCNDWRQVTETRCRWPAAPAAYRTTAAPLQLVWPERKTEILRSQTGNCCMP